MMVISGGSVTFDGIDLWMDIPRDTRTDWTLIAMERTERLNLRNCVITVRQPDGMLGLNGVDRATMFQLFPRSLSTEYDTGAAGLKNTWISMENTIARGEAHVLRTSGDLPFRLHCLSSLVSVSGNLLVMKGQHHDRSSTGATLDISRSTVDARRGLAHLSGEGLVSLRVSLTECILTWAADEALLTQLSKSESIATMMDMVRFLGVENCYGIMPSLHPLWRVEQRDDLETTVTMDFLRWSERWEKFSYTSDAIWRVPHDTTKSHSSRLPSDYKLLDESLASQRNAGVDLTTLPEVEVVTVPARTLLP
jgi:hypothetical protein